MKRFLTIMLCVLLALVPACSAMAALSLPASLQAIEAEAFAGDTSVSGVVTLPSAVTQVGDRAFADTNLFALRMPEGIQSVGSGIVSGTGALYVEIPSATATLADGALDGTMFVISPEGTVSSATPEDVNWLNADMVFTSDGFVYHYTTDAHDAAVLLFPSAPGLSGEFTVPETVNGATVVEVGDCAFWGLSGLTKVTVSDQVGMPESTTNWAENIEIEVIRTEIDPVLPDDDREKVQFFFDESALVLHPGDNTWLGTTEWPEGEWSGHSSDDSIATIDGNCYVEAHGVGNASLTIWVEDEDVFYYATITVNVVAHDVTIGQDFTEVTLPVGEIRTPYWDVNSSSYSPNFEYVFESSDESVATHDDYGLITGVAPGSATVTLIILNAADGEELARASADVTVVAQELELNESMIWAYDVFEYQLEVVTELPEDATVAWSTTDDSIIVDENGLFHTYAGEEGEGGRGFVVCTVTYADGSTATASCYVTHAPFDISFDEFTDTLVMQVDDEADRPINAYFMTFPPHMDKAVATLTSSDESIVSTDGVRKMYAHKSGTVTMTLTLSFMGISESTTYQVTVEKPYMFIDLETDTLELTVQEGEREIFCGYECSSHIDRLTVTSDNSDVAKAYLSGDRLHIIPVCEGTAVVTVTMGVGDDEHSVSVNVTVLGHTISLSKDEATLAVGESIQLTPVLLEGQEIDYNENCSYWSSDEAIASVDSEGRVIAMKAGTAMIYFDAWVNGQYARAYCEVTVTDETAQLTLSHTSLYMAQGDQVQLTAYLNGEEVSGEWTVRDTGLYVTSDGLLTLRHDWPASFSSYVTCTVVAEGETYTASCMVTGRAADVTLQCPSLLVMKVGDEDYIWANFSSTVAGENYTVRVSSSDEAVACFPNGTQDIKAVGTGECTVTVELLNSAGETVITRSCVVRVGVGIPELEQMAFAQDEYYIGTYGERTSTYLDPVLYPLSIWDLEGLTITSSDESIVSVADHHAYAVKSGKATVTMTHELYPGESVEATVYVVDPTFTASAEEVQCGDTVTFTITGLPEGVDASIGWNVPENSVTQVSSDATSLTLRTIFAGEAYVRVYLDLPGMHFEHAFVVNVTGDTKVLNYSELTLEPDRTEQLWANFGCWNTTWTSSDADVAVVDEHGNVTAIAYGECDLILTGEADDGSFSVSCHVTVADGDWRLSKIDVPAVMMVGNEYDFFAHIESTNYAWPTEENWDLGEGGQLTWVRDNVFRATAPGQATITFTCSEGEQVETASLTVLVVEPAVRLANTNFSVRPGLPCEMQFITASGKEIQSVVWSVSQDWALSVDEKNCLTATADDGRYAATATVTLTDGTTHSLSAVVSVIPDDQIYLNTTPGSYNNEFTVTEMITLPLDVNTNAFDEEITITWTSSDESIAYVEGTHGFLEASVAEVRGAGNGGDVTITCTVQVGDFITHSHDYNIYVRPADIWIDLEHDSWNISINDSSRDCCVWYGNNLPIDVLSIVSDNTDVVRVFMQHDRVYLTPVAPGTATITASISARGYSDFATMTVTVEGSSLAISPAEATLNVGDVLQLFPVVGADDELDYNDRYYESSDASIAYVNGDGQVTGLKPGTARILLRTKVNDSHVNAYCVVTVVDSSYPLTLNATRISLAQDDTFQFKALWNGEEISDVVWTVPGSAFSISSSGLLTMRHTWSEKDMDYITATVEREGETYTATCMVTGKQPEVTILMANSIVLNVGDGHWVSPYFSTSADYGTLYVSCISSDENILKVADGQSLTALAAGSCELTVQLVTEDGTAVGEKTVPVYISSELPALESILFSSDTYYLELNNHASVHVDPRFEPTLYQDQGEQVITSSDTNVVTVDGHEVRAVGAGTATISIYNALAPDVVAEATVHVYDWQVSVSATDVSLGDLITVTMSGLEDAELTSMYFNTDESMLRPVGNGAPEYYTFRAMQSGEVWLQVHADAEEFNFWRDIQFNISASEGEYLHLNETDTYREPGHEFDLWPEFEASTLAWSSTDEAVATVDESGHVKVVGEGECEIVLEGELPDGTGYRAVCVLHAAWGEWTLKAFHLDDVLYVGNTYGKDFYFESTYGAGPDSVELSVEGDAVELIDDNTLRAVKAGTATVTLTASRGEDVQSITKTVLVVEPAAYLEESNFDLRPGQSVELKLVPGTGREITGIVWSSSDDEALSVSTDGVATLLAQDGQYTVTADVWLADGATLTVTAMIGAISNGDVYFNAGYSDYAEMLVTETCQLQLDVDTNALEDEVVITWTSENEEIATVENTWGFAAASVAEVRGGGPGGDVTVVCTVDIGDFFHEEYRFNLHVHSADVWINLEHDSWNIHTRDSRQECAVWYGSNLPIDTLNVVSDNTDVVRVFMEYDRVSLTPVAPGTATITASISARGYGHSDTMTITVEGGSVSLNVAEATLNVGDTLQLAPVVGEGQNLDYGNRSYSSSNPDIAYVNGDGMVSALKAGTARICLQTHVDGQEAYAWCSVTVVDESQPLTLNAGTVSLSRSESFQLKALWNGEEVSDAVWSVTNNAISVSSTGLVTLRHTWSEKDADYVTATVVREGETYTAACMVTGKQSDITVLLESAIVLNVGDDYWVNPYFSTAADYGTLSILCTSSDAELLTVEDNQGLKALAAGSCELTVQLIAEDGTVVYEKTIPVYISSEIPALETISFGFDSFHLDLNSENRAHTDPYTVPAFYQEYSDLVVTSSNESVAMFDGYEIRAVGVGTATISVYSPLAPDQVATATVHVYDWQVSISATEVNAGDLVTVTMSGLEDLPLTNMYCNYDGSMMRLIEDGAPDTYTFRAMNPGETWLEVRAETAFSSFWSSFQIVINGSEGEYLHLNETDVYYEPGSEFDLWPEFEASNCVWSSTDESVATVDENGHVKVVGEGECEIVLECETPSGACTASCTVYAANGEWTLKEFHLDDVLYVGSTYGSDCHIEKTYNAWPDSIKLSVEGDAVELIDDSSVRAVKAGTATVTLTATSGEQVEFITKTVLVIEPAVRLEESNFDLRPGQSAEAKVIVGSDRELGSIEWKSSNEEALTVTADGVITPLASEGEYSAVATVTLTDGTTASLTVRVHIIPDSEIYLNLGMDDYHEKRIFDEFQLSLNLDTNAYDGEVTVEWSSDNESVVTVTPVADSYLNTLADLYVCGSGEASITCTVRIGDFKEESRTCYIWVSDYEFSIAFNDDVCNLELRNTDQDTWLNITDHNIGHDTVSVTSSDTNVVRAYAVGDRVKMIPVAEGTATLTVTMTRKSMSVSDTMEVVVSGKALELTYSSLELAAGESIVVSPVLNDGEVINQSNRNYQSSNKSVAVVDSDGVIHALSAGTTVITLETEIDVTPDDGETNYIYARASCTVTVTDPDYPLTLNESAISLVWQESFQLQALWNGEEITDVTWSSSDHHAVTVTSGGLVYMGTEYVENHSCCITATVEREGVTYTATCLVSGLMNDVRIDAVEAIWLNVGNSSYIDAGYTSTVANETYTLVITSSDETIARISEDGRNVVALASGTVTLTIALKDSSGETVATRTCMVYVESELPELEFIGFQHDVYFVTVQSTAGDDNHDYATHTGPYTIPNSVRDLQDVELTSADSSIARVEGHSVYGVAPGSTTITLSHPLYPGQTATATVYVFDLSPAATADTIQVGDTATLSVSLDDIPEEYINSAYWTMNDYNFSWAAGGWDDWTIRGRRAGTDEITFHLELPDRYIERKFYITVEGEEYLLNASDVTMEPNRSKELWPEFECENRVWSSSNESVATVDENGNVTSLAYGTSVITLEATHNETGETVTATCQMTVADGEWHLADIAIADILYVGNAYWPDAALNAYYEACPEAYQWTTSDSSILVLSEEDGHFHALKVGTVDITVTATEGEQVETFTKTVHVCEPKVRLSSTSPALRPGASETLELVTAAGYTVESVEWKISTGDYLTVDGNTFTMNMDAPEDSNTRFTATVTLNDDSVHTLTGWYHCLRSDELEYDFRLDTDYRQLQLGMGDSASVHLWTNAAEHETYLTWYSYDESILRLGEQNDQINTEVELIPVGTGVTTLACRMELGEGACYRGDTILIEVEVINNGYVNLIYPDVWLRPTASAYPDYTVLSDVTVESVEWAVDDPSALSIDDTGCVTLLASEGEYGYSATFTMADGTVLTLYGKCYAIPDSDVHFEASIWPDYEMEVLQYDYGTISLSLNTNAAPGEIYIEWWSSDSEIASVVAYEGQACQEISVEGVGLGYATIYCAVEIRSGDTSLHSQTFEVPVNVYEIGG